MKGDEGEKRIREKKHEVIEIKNYLQRTEKDLLLSLLFWFTKQVMHSEIA